jgi:hypothetical protein
METIGRVDARVGIGGKGSPGTAKGLLGAWRTRAHVAAEMRLDVVWPDGVDATVINH